MQIWAESGKSALPICNYSQILYQFLTFTQNLKRSLFINKIEVVNVSDLGIRFCIIFEDEKELAITVSDYIENIAF